MGFLAAGAALEKAYKELKRAGSSKSLPVSLYDFREFSALRGFDDIAEFDRRYRG